MSVASEFSQSTEEATALLMEPDKIPGDLLVKTSAAASGRYSTLTDMIMAEFERENFLGLMYSLNSSMDVSQ